MGHDEFAILRSAQEVKDRGQPFYLADNDNLKVGLALVRGLSNSPAGPTSALGFGFPGTGKSSFAHALAWEVCAVPAAPLCNHVLEVRCLNIARLAPDDARQRLNDIWEKIFHPDHVPLLAFFDEIDTISKNRNREEPSRVTLTEWMMALLKQMNDDARACCIIGMTNYVAKCDDVIGTEIGARMYFPLPSSTTLLGILEKQSIPNAGEVLATYMTRCGTELVPVHRTLAVAIKNLKKLVPHWEKLDAKALAGWLFSLVEPPSKKRFDEFIAENQRQINHARDLEELLH